MNEKIIVTDRLYMEEFIMFLIGNGYSCRILPTNDDGAECYITNIEPVKYTDIKDIIKLITAER